MSPEQRKIYRDAQRQRQRALIWREKDKPCADCGARFPPYCMDFDHNGTEKTHGIAAMVARYSDAKIFAEIRKCDVVCAVCHRIRTHSA